MIYRRPQEPHNGAMPTPIFLAALGAFVLLEIPGFRRTRRPSPPLILLPGAGLLFPVLPDLGALVGGVVLVISASDWLIDGAGSLARRAGAPLLLVGVLIVGLGTSTPELFINLISAIRGDTALALGNILGSNIANLSLVIGPAVLIAGPVRIQKSLISAEVPIMLGAALLLAVLLMDGPPLTAGRDAGLSRQDGVVLLLGLAFYLLYSFHSLGQSSSPRGVGVRYGEGDTTPLSVAKVLAGIAGLYLGGEFTITGAVNLAATLGAGTVVLGVIIGVGTSLPELATALTCAFKGETDLVVGNVVGSNIFNILLILGITALVRPVDLPIGMGSHLPFLLAATALFFLSLGTRRTLNRLEAVFLALIGSGYILFSILQR